MRVELNWQDMEFYFCVVAHLSTNENTSYIFKCCFRRINVASSTECKNSGGGVGLGA